MTEMRLSLSGWRTLAKEDPEQVVDRFFSGCDQLPHHKCLFKCDKAGRRSRLNRAGCISAR